MTEGIIIAIIAAAASVFGNLIALAIKNSSDKESQAVRDALVDARLESIEQKVDEHNNYAKCFHNIQVDIAVIKSKLSIE